MNQNIFQSSLKVLYNKPILVLFNIDIFFKEFSYKTMFHSIRGLQF